MFAGASPTSEQQNQNVTINFIGEDNLTQVVDKVNMSVQKWQLSLMAANLSLKGLDKGFEQFTGKSIKNIDALSKAVGVADKALQKAFNISTLAKVGAVLADGILKATRELRGLENGLKAMEASGYSTQILQDFKQLKDAILLDKQALEQFTLQALTAYNRFAKAKSEVEVLFKPGDEFVKNLSTNIQNLVNNDLKNAVTSIDALSASYQAASALFTDAADNQAVMVSGLKLAKAGGADASAVMKVLTQTIRAYGLAANDADKVSAALNKTIQLGITTLPELSQGFAQTAVVAKEAGIKLEELSGAVAALTLKGSSTPTALTGIESLARVIINKTPEATAALKELRDEAGKPIKFDISEIKAKGLTLALQDLNKATNGNAQVLADIIPESLAYSTALGLMADNAAQLASNAEDIGKTIETGSTAKKALEEVFNIKLNNQAEKFEQIVNRITEQFIQFGENLAPFFDAGVSALEGVNQVLGSISPEMKKMIANFLIAQMTLNQFGTALGAITDSVIKAAGIFAGWRLTTSLFNGTLLQQKDIIIGLVKTNAGLLPIIKQLVGLDQSHLVTQTNLNTVTKSKVDLLNQLRTGEGGRLEALKQLIGLDKSYILNTEEAITNSEVREKLFDNQINKQSLVIKANKELQKAEEELNNIKQKGTKAFQEYDKALEKQLKNEQDVANAREKLANAETFGDNDGKVKAQADLIALEKQKILIQQEQSIAQEKINEQQDKYLAAQEKVKEQEGKVQDARTVSRKNFEETYQNMLGVQELEIKSIKATAQANRYAEKAENLRALAKVDTARASRLLAAAEKAEAVSKAFSAKATDASNAAQGLNLALKAKARIASLEQAVAEGKLIVVNTALGKTYVANNIFSRILYRNMSKDLDLAIVKTKILAATDVKDVGKGIKNILSTDISGVFKNIGEFGTKAFTSLSGAMSKLVGLFKGGTVAIGGIQMGLAALAAPLIGLVAIGAVLHDQFYGTSAEVRKLNENLDNAQVELDKNLLKYLETQDAAQKLTDSEKARLANLKENNKVADETSSIWTKAGNIIGGVFGAIWEAIIYLPKQIILSIREISNFIEDLLLNIPIVGEFASNLLDVFTSIVTLDFGKLMESFRLDQVQDSVNRINKSVEQLQNNIIDAIKKNKELEAGRTGSKKVDDKLSQGIKGGEIDVTEQAELQKEYERQNKIVELESQKAEKEIEALNEKLKNYDELKAKGEKNLSEADQQLDRERSKLEAVNENRKRILDTAKENQKAAIELIQDRNRLIKTVNENNLITDEQDKKSTTKLVDVGANAVETRLKKSLRQSKEEFDKFTNIYKSWASGSTEVIENGVKRSINVVKDLGAKPTEKFKELIRQQMGEINQLYEFGSISAEEAARKTEELLKTKLDDGKGFVLSVEQVLDNSEYLEFLKENYELIKKEGDAIISKFQDEGEMFKQLQAQKLKGAVETNAKLREINLKTTEIQIQQLEKDVEFQRKFGSTEAADTALRKLNILTEKYNAMNIENNIAAKNDLLEVEKNAADSMIKVNQAYIGARIGNQLKLNQGIRDLELQQIEFSRKQLENQLAEYQKNPNTDPEEIAKLQQQITAIFMQEQAKRTANNVADKNDVIELEKSKNNDLLKLNQIYFSARIGNQLKIFQDLKKLELKNIQDSKQQLENELAEIKKLKDVDPEQVAKIERQITIITAEEKAKRLDLSQKEIEIRYKKQFDGYEKEAALIKLNKEKAAIGAEESIQQLESVQKKSNLARQQQLQQQLAVAKKAGAETIDIEKQILSTQLEYQQILTNAIERQYQNRIKELNLVQQREELSYKKTINTLDQIKNEFDEEVKIINSRNGLIKAGAEIEEQRLQNQLRITSDIQKRADIETKIVENKQKSLVEQQAMEKQSFLLQQKTNDLALQRQQIELNIRRLQNESSRKILELEKEKAVKEKINERDIEAIDLKLAANIEENKVLESSQNLLERSKENQKEITSNSLRELEARQQIARDGGALDLQISKEQQILAGYDKRAKSASIVAQIQELSSQQQLKSQAFITAAYDRRLNLINQQLKAEEQNTSMVGRQFQMAMNLETNERKKAKLAEQAAKAELAALNKKHEIEQQVLEIQMKSNRAALQRSKLEQEIAKVKIDAEVKLQEAETQRVLADRTKTKEEKDAAVAMLNAKQFEAKAQGYQDVLLKQRESDLYESEQMEKYNLRQRQRNERQDKTIAVAQTTRTKSDDKAILRAIRDTLPNYGRGRLPIDRGLFGMEFSNQQFNVGNVKSFEEYMKENVVDKIEVKQRNSDIYNQQLNRGTQQAQQQTGAEQEKNKKAPIVINFNNTNEIKIEGDKSKLDYAKELESITTKTMYDVVRKVNVELGKV